MYKWTKRTNLFFLGEVVLVVFAAVAESSLLVKDSRQG